MVDHSVTSRREEIFGRFCNSDHSDHRVPNAKVVDRRINDCHSLVVLDVSMVDMFVSLVGEHDCRKTSVVIKKRRLVAVKERTVSIDFLCAS